LNINLITGAEVEKVSGVKGNFKITLRKAPRYVDSSKCTACGDCAKVCPVELPNEYDQGLSTRRAIYKKYAQAIPGAFAVQKADKAPCRLACPAGLNVQGYVQMVKEGKYKEALEIIMEELPLPGVLGRICPHGCEEACRRCDKDEPVAIRDLKRLAADLFDPRGIEIQCLPPRPEKVAIIGSGPAGLSAAYHLAKKGIRATIFEALSQAGGMLRVGIPEHRLPRKILDQEIEGITNLGVEIKTNTPLCADRTVDDLFTEGFAAVYLAIGAHRGVELGIPGEKSRGVQQGVDFLRELNLSGGAQVGRKVAIIGGGNVAIDVARSAARFGAEEVHIVYRRTRAEMPAWEEERVAAEEEGIRINYLSAPQEILTEDGTVVGLRCIRMELGAPDSSGRRRPIPVPGSEHDMVVDQVIPAIGQTPDLSALEDIAGLSFSRWGTVDADTVTYATGRNGVFAGGDLHTGPWIAIGAIAAGREAAESIVRYLDGCDMAEGRTPLSNEHPVYRPIPDGEPRKKRGRTSALPLKERHGNFEEVELGYDEATGREEAGRCLNCGYCCECYQCVAACGPHAVSFETHREETRKLELEVGSVILAPGFVPFDPSRYESYNYVNYPNIVTSMEFERILSASGPTMGHLVRPSDGKEPRKIAWLQCVGSRDINRADHGYCSSVCCMYAIKEAVISKEHAKEELDCAIFFMDMRTHGKDFEHYYESAREKHGVRFIRSRVHTIDPLFETGDLVLKYVNENGELVEETFDMVVLSVGMETSKENLELAETLGLTLTKGQFCATHPFSPVNTSREGIYVCGAFQGPKDIPQSVTEASAAACAAAVDLSSARWTQTKSKDIPEELDVSSQEPRIGVFVCNCGTNIGGVVDVSSVEHYASALPHVVHVEQSLFTCAQDSQDRMKSLIQEHNLNRVVVAACTPRTHEPLFQETLQACGLNKFLFEMANIRNQDSWVHSGDPASATEKAKDLVRMAVARAALLKPLSANRITVNKRALVIGGGIAGMTAALSLGDQGFEVVLVEKEPHLGGLSRELTHTIEGAHIFDYLLDMAERVTRHDRIQVLTESLIVGFSGFKGNFTTEVMVGPGMYERKIDHGVVIVATGAEEYRPTEFLYGQDTRVLTQIEFGKRLEEKGAEDLNHVIMIQCVGSRNKDFANCSRICCQNAIKNALHIKELNPETEVSVFYRDIRTYGELEYYYQQARRQGVRFFRFHRDEPPQVSAQNGDLSLTFRDPILQRELRLHADLLVLSAGMRPADTEELSSIIKLPRNPDGYFMEAHVKLRPVDMANEGIYVCGTAHSPKLISEAVAQAMAASSRAATFLSQSEITLSAVTAKVDQERCASCLICVRACPYGVPHINKEGVSEIDEALCRGCGICAAECPAKAIELGWYEDNQVMSKVDALLEGVL
jgi:heterodisulfide reductase subunit A-like polyferredoxin